MMYCTKCGSDLKGSKTRCPVCGYPVEKMRQDLSKPRETRREKETPKPWAPPIPDQRKEQEKHDARIIEEKREPERYDRKPGSEGGIRFMESGREDDEVDPTIVDGCYVCGSRPDKRCFFCLSPVCPRHTVDMKIYVRNMPFGGKVSACPKCSNQRNGRNPTPSEAKEAGMYFTIKPYHEWRKV
jgi:ribosomal protein L37E